MRSAHFPRSRCARIGHLWLLFGMISIEACAFYAWADVPSLVVTRVEEDWELVVAEPDVYSDAPQVTTVISPFGHLESTYATFEFNHRSQPHFSAGGLQVQVWNGDNLAANRTSDRKERLRLSGEKVRWTQVIDLSDGQLSFKITDGDSKTWGAFGGGDSLRVDVASALTTLAGYSPSVSVDNSGVGYAGNRVASLKLKTVRRYLAGNVLLDENTDAVVVHANH